MAGAIAFTEYLAEYLEQEQNSFQPICEAYGDREPIDIDSLKDTIDRAIDAFKSENDIEHIVGA